MMVSVETKFSIGDKVYPIYRKYKHFSCGVLPVYGVSKTPSEVQAIKVRVTKAKTAVQYVLEYDDFYPSWVYSTWEEAYERVCYLNTVLPNE